MSVNLKKSEIKARLSFLESRLHQPPTAIVGLYKLPRLYSKEVIKSRYSEVSVQKIADHIGYFLGIVHPIKISVIRDSSYAFGSVWYVNPSGQAQSLSDQGYSSSVAGFYRVKGLLHNEIQINLQFQFKLEHLLAVLAHECTHNYLHHYGVNEKDSRENEILTDLAAVYLGLGHLLLKGYAPIIWTSDYNGTSYIRHSQTIGYVSRRSIRKALVLAIKSRHFSIGEILWRVSVSEFLPVFVRLVPQIIRQLIIGLKDKVRFIFYYVFDSYVSKNETVFYQIEQEMGRINSEARGLRINLRVAKIFIRINHLLSTGEIENEILSIKRNSKKHQSIFSMFKLFVRTIVLSSELKSYLKEIRGALK